MTMPTMLESATDVLDALGGAPAAANITGSSPKAVYNWKAFGKFPSKTYLAMTRALRERGFDAPPALWGMR